NFYPVTLADLAMAERQGNMPRLERLRALRTERFELMERLAQLPSDMVFFTQITMEAAEDAAFLTAMRRANIKGALVGVEAVTPEGSTTCTRASTTLARRRSHACARSATMAFMCSVRSSSGSRAIARPRSQS